MPISYSLVHVAPDAVETPLLVVVLAADPSLP